MSTPIKVVTDTATPALRELLKNTLPNRSLMARMGKSLERILRRFFISKDSQPNKQGWPKSHFWSSRVATSTLLTSVTATDAEVTVGEPAYRTHFYGATIVPRTAKALTIPLVPEAKGIYPSSGLITGLFIRRSKGGAAFLARREGNKIVNYFILLKSVTIPRDPKAAPDRHDVDRELLREATLWFNRHQPPR